MPHRYFTTEIQNDRAFLSGADARHLAVVLRAKPGMNVTLCDGAGTDYACAVRTADPDRVELEIISTAPSASEPSVPVTLYVGYPKQDKLEWIIQKAVELGAVEIVPFFSRFCVAAPQKRGSEKRAVQPHRLRGGQTGGPGRDSPSCHAFDLCPDGAAGCGQRPGAFLLRGGRRTFT